MDGIETEVTRRATAISVSIEGDALLDEAADSVATMRRLLEHSDRLDEHAATALRETLPHFEERVSRRETHVAVAGVSGSGKRTFFDALYGDRRVSQARGRGGANVVTFLRNRATPSYRATFADGTTEDFALLVPDRSREHDGRVREAEAGFAEAQRVHGELEARAKTAAGLAARANEELRRAGRSAESALEVEQATTAGFASAQRAEEEAQRALTLAESSIPVRLRQRRSTMRFWLRLWRALFILFRKETWRALEAARAALFGARERTTAMRERMTAAAEDRQQTRALMREPEALADKTRAAADEARSVADRAHADLARARGAMEERREELSRYVEARLSRFFGGIQRLCNEHGTAENVIELTIDYAAELIPEDVVLIDLPDLRDEARRARVWRLIQEVADGCVLLWDLERKVDAPTIELFRRIRRLMPHAFLVLNKVDATFLRAVQDGHAEPWERVDEARRAATSKFAEQIERDPSSVLSLAVAAKVAIEDPDSGLAERFRAEAEKLFELLRQERAILLGSRVAELVAISTAATREAKRQAVMAYKAHVAEFASQRMPEPEAFHRSALRDAEPLFERASTSTIEDVSALVSKGYAALKASARAFAMTESGGASTLLDRERVLAAGAKKLEAKVEKALESALTTSVEALESRLFEELGKRYRIPKVRTLRSAPPELPPRAGGLDTLAHPRVPALVKSFRRTRALLGLFGSALGATGGWFSAPALSGVTHVSVPVAVAAGIGGVLGTVLAFTKTWSGTRAAALLAMETALTEEEQAALQRVAARAPDLTEAMRSTLDSSIEQVIIRHGQEMTEPTEAGERALHAERATVGDLQEIAAALKLHADRLETLGGSTAELSMLECR